MTAINLRIPVRVLSAIRNRPWAMTAEALATMTRIASRDPRDILEKLSIRIDPGAPRSEDSHARVRGRTAIIPIRGAIFRYATWLDDLCGTTSYESILREISGAVADGNIDRIVLEIDSPGGEVTGCSETAHAIRRMGATKPIFAFVDGDACSAAYWLASACQEIAGWRTAHVGCVGVVAHWVDYTRAEEEAGIDKYYIVSSQTPAKISDPQEEEGLARLQEEIDRTADAFLDDLAEFRGIDPAGVAAAVGEGKVFTGKEAYAAGMLDVLATFEDYLQDLESQAKAA